MPMGNTAGHVIPGMCIETPRSASRASCIKGILSRLQDVVNTAWAFAHLEQYPGLGLMEGIVEVLRTSLSSMSVSQAACLLWACAVQRHHPRKPTLAALLSKLKR